MPGGARLQLDVAMMGEGAPRKLDVARRVICPGEWPPWWPSRGRRARFLARG